MVWLARGARAEAILPESVSGDGGAAHGECHGVATGVSENQAGVRYPTPAFVQGFVEGAIKRFDELN